MALRIGKQQLAEHDTLAADLCKKVEALNIVIVAFNKAIGPQTEIDPDERAGPIEGASPAPTD
jgi:hypothetical protein